MTVASTRVTGRVLPRAPVVLLVDFSNFFPPGHGPAGASEARHLLIGLLRQVVSHFPDCGWVLFRLYGGWIEGGAYSADGSRALQLAELANPFPVVVPGEKRVLRGEVEVATGLLRLPGLSVGDTFRRHPGPRRTRLAVGPLPEGCAGTQTTCGARAVARFTRSLTRTCPVEGCSVTAEAAFIVHEQKKVDVMMACDLLHLARDDSVVAVVVVSCDTDLVPALHYSAVEANTNVILSPARRCWSAHHVEVFRETGVAMWGLGDSDEP